MLTRVIHVVTKTGVWILTGLAWVVFSIIGAASAVGGLVLSVASFVIGAYVVYKLVAWTLDLVIP